MLVSVIIPALNEVQNIQQCIAAARWGYTPDEVEIIVVDGGSTDGTPDLVVPEAALLHSPRGRAIQMNRGVAASQGGILVFCHADSQLPAGWRGYRKFRVVDGKLAGALLLGQRYGQLAIHKAIGQPVAQFGADVARPDFPWNDLTGQDWDYCFY